MVADNFEEFEPPSKKFLPMPLVIIALFSFVSNSEMLQKAESLSKVWSFVLSTTRPKVYGNFRMTIGHTIRDEK